MSAPEWLAALGLGRIVDHTNGPTRGQEKNAMKDNPHTTEPSAVVEDDAGVGRSPSRPRSSSPSRPIELAELADYQDQGAALMRTVDRAVQQGVTIDVIERLLVVHERIEANEARKQYNAAMGALRADLPEIVKTERVEYKGKGGQIVSYLHEKLSRMVEQLNPVMAKHGFAFRWSVKQKTPATIKVTCHITHAAGHAEKCTLFGSPDDTGSKNKIQAIASTVEYLKRYTLKAALGLAAGPDDDGEGGAPVRGDNGQAPIEQPRATGEQPASGAGIVDAQELVELEAATALFPAGRDKTISANQQGRLYNLARKAGWTNEGVDAELGLVLEIKASEIPSTGPAYEAIVRWFQAHPPANAGGGS